MKKNMISGGFKVTGGRGNMLENSHSDKSYRLIRTNQHLSLNIQFCRGRLCSLSICLVWCRWNRHSLILFSVCHTFCCHWSKFGYMSRYLKAHIYYFLGSFCLSHFFFLPFLLTLYIFTTDFLVRLCSPSTTTVATLCVQNKTGVAHLTLSLCAEDTSRRQQNPTGDPHLSDLSSPPSCNHGSRSHRRVPGAPSQSPRWEHVARWPHTPREEESWLLLVLCVRLLLTGDGGEWLRGGEEEEDCGESSLRQRAPGIQTGTR